MKIGLGTANFGMDYGLTNSTGKMDSVDAHELLEVSAQEGCAFLDTSPAYGNAEAVLGAYANLQDFKVITKTVNSKISEMSEEKVTEIMSGFERSLKAMGISECYGLLIHNPDDLKSRDAHRLTERLQQLRYNGKVQKIGISVYGQEDIERAKSIFDFDLIQLPLNVFNQDLAHSGILKALRSDGVEIHARSIFLQGVALTSPEKLPTNLRGLSANLFLLHEIAEKFGVSCLDLCVEYVKQIGYVDSIIVGANSPENFLEISNHRRIKSNDINWLDFGSNDPYLTNPVNWVTG